MSIGYDAAGNRNRVTWPDTNYVEYDIDGLNRTWRGRENGVAMLATFVLDPLSRRTGITRGNSTVTSAGYDLASRLDTLGQRLNVREGTFGA